MKTINILMSCSIILIIAVSCFSTEIYAEVLTGVVIEGDSMFNGTTEPQNRPYKQPYTEEELKKVKFSAERGSKLFILTEDGKLYYPTPKKGDIPAQTPNALRFPRVFGPDVNSKTLFKWLTLVHVIGLEIEVTGEVYPGHGDINGFHIETIKCDHAEESFQQK